MNILNKSIRTCRCERSEAIQPLENASDHRPRNDHLPLLFTRDNKGTTAIEFSILLPPLIMIIFGMIEFGLLMFNKQVITNASREGARCGIVQQSPNVSVGAIEAVVNDYCLNHLVTFGATGPPTTTVTPGEKFPDPLTVRVEYHYDFLVLPSFVGSLVGGTDLVAETVMRME